MIHGEYTWLDYIDPVWLEVFGGNRELILLYIHQKQISGTHQNLP